MLSSYRAVDTRWSSSSCTLVGDGEGERLAGTEAVGRPQAVATSRTPLRSLAPIVHLRIRPTVRCAEVKGLVIASHASCWMMPVAQVPLDAIVDRCFYSITSVRGHPRPWVPPWQGRPEPDQFQDTRPEGTTSVVPCRLPKPWPHAHPICGSGHQV